MPAKSQAKIPPVTIPPVTIVVEWENAIDVGDQWTDSAMAAFEAELERTAPLMGARPKVTYLYDQNVVDPAIIETALARNAPKLHKLANLEILPTEGLTYYKLKNFGIARATTPISVMLDSDAAPQPGWLEHLLAPFADPKIMAVGGFTVLGHEDLLSKTMALSWIFNLPEERDKTVKRAKIHANNCAVRTDFFNANPFPDLPAFKKQCGFWLRDMDARGHQYVRTAEAMTIHAPHPGFLFLVWRAWTMGLDRDYQAFQTVTRSRLGRVGHAFRFFGKKVGKSWFRIAAKGDLVGLPGWQRPFAMAISLGFYGIGLIAEIKSALTRGFEPLPAPPRPRAKGHKRASSAAAAA